jgi:hypothetical protein
MACYSLDFLILSGDTEKVDTCASALPDSKDVKVVESLYEVSAKSETVADAKSTYTKSGMIRYKTEEERDKAYDTMVNSFKDEGILSGSYVQKHTCYHDEKDPKPCPVPDRYEKK